MRALPSHTRKAGANGRLARRMIVASVVVVVVISSAFAVLFRSVVDLRAAQRLAHRSEGLVITAIQAEGRIHWLETQVRDHALTGQPQFLQSLRAAQAGFAEEAAALTHLTRGNPEERARAEQIQHTGLAYFKKASMPLVNAAKHDPATARATVTNEESRTYVEAMQNQYHRIVDTEQTFAAAREERAAAAANRAVVATVAGLTGSVVVIVGFAGYVTRALVHPVRRTATMAGRLAGGDLTARTPVTGVGEIGALERSFNRMADALQQGHDELSTSRSRILAAADEARRRIERDLHDGTQQRLVTLVLELRAAQGSIPAHQPELKAMMARLTESLIGASDELRELSRGIHPAVLSQGGLKPALKALARRSPLPVDLHVDVARLPEPLEVAAYYVVSEALANTAKHALASHAHVRVRACADEILCLCVHDDGVGGATLGRGSGLVGLTDRVRALGGTLTLHSPAGQGTTLQVCFPSAASA